MKANKQKMLLAMSRKCMNLSDLSATAEMPAQSVKNALAGRGIRPATLGRIAKALGVDVTEILAEED